MSFLAILFWLLFILACLGFFGAGGTLPPGQSPWFDRGWRLVILILIGILGFKGLGNPFS